MSPRSERSRCRRAPGWTFGCIGDVKEFVKDPRSVVKPGDIVRVKVLEVDKPRRRISLSLRLDD